MQNRHVIAMQNILKESKNGSVMNELDRKSGLLLRGINWYEIKGFCLSDQYADDLGNSVWSHD